MAYCCGERMGYGLNKSKSKSDAVENFTTPVRNLKRWRSEAGLVECPSTTPRTASYMTRNPFDDFLNEQMVEDYAGLDYSNETNPRDEHSEEIVKRLDAVLSGRFTAPGITDTRDFTNILTRHHSAMKFAFKKQVNNSRRLKRVLTSNFDELPIQAGVVYDAALESPSPGNSNRVYTRAVPDWDWLSGREFDVYWWNDDRENGVWERNIDFWCYAECQEAHREKTAGSGGPKVAGWCCGDDGDINGGLFWSTAILFKFAGSSGVKYWDDQFKELKDDREVFDLIVGSG